MMNRVLQTRRRMYHLIAALCCLSLGACSWVPKGESQLDVGIKERGIASWYGEQFHGKQAANGEIFDMGALTAAHRTLPLGSMIRVTNLTNGKHVRVRINDRGPYVNGRILDLSLAAADRLGMVAGGLSVIQLEVIGDRRPDFMLAAEESAQSTSPLLSVHRLNQPELRVLPVSVLAHADPTMTPVHRLPPTDILLQRRLRRVGSMLAADHTAHTENVTLILG
ncbi:MAG: septal ring lytic transglycosylase RlpA family protein [Nitrospira sp.]|jgi:rare lipoprotein A|nr:septal ring lytic transglycosylase RlpA family protein [Nitrospira sp.]